MKHFSLVLLALAVVLCGCNEIEDEENDPGLIFEEEKQERFPGCTPQGESCTSHCQCCRGDLYCNDGWFSDTCEFGDFTDCRRKRNECENTPEWKTYRFKCRPPKRRNHKG
nr:venom protein [Lampona murina]